MPRWIQIMERLVTNARYIKKWFSWFWANLTRVGNNADFVNAGDDVRYDPCGRSSAIQRTISFKSKREYVPGIFVGLFPPPSTRLLLGV